MEQPEGKKNEKTGKVMKDAQQRERGKNLELLESIDSKLDTLIAATQEKEE